MCEGKDSEPPMGGKKKKRKYKRTLRPRQGSRTLRRIKRKGWRMRSKGGSRASLRRREGKKRGRSGQVGNWDPGGNPAKV